MSCTQWACARLVPTRQACALCWVADGRCTASVLPACTHIARLCNQAVSSLVREGHQPRTNQSQTLVGLHLVDHTTANLPVICSAALFGCGGGGATACWAPLASTLGVAAAVRCPEALASAAAAAAVAAAFVAAAVAALSARSCASIAALSRASCVAARETTGKQGFAIASNERLHCSAFVRVSNTNGERVLQGCR
jgi:hypothetical protein